MGILLIWAFLTLFMGRALTHLVITNPPARKYDLDFLDNVRTPAPCGMPKGKIGTSILKGSTLNVTWHLVNPHQGGFLLELLDGKEQRKMYLSSRNGEYNSLDTTSRNGGIGVQISDLGLISGKRFDKRAQSYEVKFPDDLECRGCSIRLLRQAKEWGDANIFWSCADIDIVPTPEVKIDCSGNGQYVSNRCICNIRFFGDYCQYENECIADEDCGKYGLCLDLQATSYPKRQCFCSRGYFGNRCSKSSSVSSESQVNFGVYTRRNLSDAMTLYWRILKEADEIEVVLVNKGTNFAAIGWRAGDATTACRNFPKISGPPPPTAIAKVEPKTKSEPEPEPEPKSKPLLSSRKVAPLPAGGEVNDRHKKRRSIADPQDNFSGRKRRHSINGGRSDIWVSSPVLKPSSQVHRLKRNPQISKQPKAAPESSAEPVAEAEVEAQPELEPRSGVSGSSPYVPKGNELHAMDCTDIVVGAARDGFYRVKDYYTRDRSTPRPDEFWGEEDSITAAFGWEKDGETTILFRKKLTATHPSDHSITPGLMHVIWSRGQEPNKYIHVPKSGLEVGTPSISDFYRLDELTYHGRGDQRGAISVNFFEQANNLVEEGVDWCGGQWKYPHSCSPVKNDCEYFARWEYFEKTDDIYFTISSSHSNLWTGIGFSGDTRMIGSDVVLGWVTPQGNYNMFDGWLNNYAPPTVDSKQSVFNHSASQIDGITTLNFARKRRSNDEMDLSFTDDQCLFLLFPIMGGTVDYANKAVSKHQRIPIVSQQRICIKSCNKKFGGIAGKQ